MLDNPNYIKVLDKGFVLLTEIMGSDQSIAESARVSYGKGTKTVFDDRNLIRYLVNHKHTSPLEMAELKFLIKMPIFVDRQFGRHRTASKNEASLRYSEPEEDFYLPEISRFQEQSKNNKQGSGESLPEYLATDFQKVFNEVNKSAINLYNIMSNHIDGKLAKETARDILPLTYYTKYYWKCDLNNILKLLLLRQDKHSQWEIRQYANAIFELVKKHFPITAEAYIDYMKEAKSFSRMELKLLKNIFDEGINMIRCKEDYGLSKREWDEFWGKIGEKNG